MEQRERDSPAVLPVFRFLGFVGLDAANVMRSALHQGAHQVVGLFLRKGGRRERRMMKVAGDG